MTLAPPERPATTAAELDKLLDDSVDADAGRRSRLPEGWVLALVAAGLYIWAGWWLKYTYHFSIGDSLARSADAKFMLFSRDAHAAAIGVYWMPLPTVSEIPAMLAMGPSHHYEFAGPITSALWTAFTIPVLLRIARDLGAPRLTGVLIAVAYAANPVVVFYAANGMAEACEFFWVAVLLWGLLQLVRRPYFAAPTLVGPSVIAGIGLAGLCLAKYEATPAIGAVAVIILILHFRDLIHRRWQSFATEFCLTVVPALFVVGLWLVYQRVITGSFTSFLTVGQVTATGAGTTSVVAAAEGSVGKSTHYVVHYLAGFGPAVGMLVLLALRPAWHRLLQAVAVAGIGLAIVMLSAHNIYTGGSLGNPRYFMPMVIIAAVACLVVAAALSHGWKRVLVDPLLVLALVAGWVGGVRVERGITESVEHEGRVFDALDGHYDSTPTTGDYALGYEEAADAIDARVRPGDRVLLDTRFEFGVALYTHKLKQFVITSDRDYEQIVAPDGASVRLDWAVVAPSNGAFAGSTQNDDAGAVVSREPGWTKVASLGVADLWHRDPRYNVNLPYPKDG